MTGSVCLTKTAAGGATQKSAVQEFADLAAQLANGEEIAPQAEEDSDDQLDPNGWCVDSECADNQDDENPLNDKDCAMPPKLFTAVSEDGSLVFEDNATSAGTSSGVSWVLFAAVVAVAVQQFL